VPKRVVGNEAACCQDRGSGNLSRLRRPA
jgi:hypothetical protein